MLEKKCIEFVSVAGHVSIIRKILIRIDDHNCMPMRHFLLTLFSLSILIPAGFSQNYSLEEEVVSADIGLLVGALGIVDLTGYSCTRYYVNMENTDDFMSSVSGDETNPTYVNTTTSFYHATLGAATPNGINSLLFPVYPDLVYDSWVTIGLEGVPNAAAGEAAVATVQSTDNPWSTNFDPGGGLPGGNIAIDDAIGGAWYALNGDANGVAGDDLKVLVGQFTTEGELSGQLYCQIFINGDGSDEYRETFFIGAPPAVPGCIDETACNFDATATEDDGSCTYADPGLNCDGSCIADTDGDGICDGDEVPGCTDDTACNYDVTATDDDSSCTYADPGLNCDGSCIEDTDGDGICDGDELAGCTDNTALNYDENATDDDGSCEYGCAPEWGDPVTLPSIATVLAQVTIAGENAASNDIVGAFINGELRGEGNIIDYEGGTYINMTVYLAGGEETITFALFNAEECSVCNIDGELTSMGFGEYGSFDDPLMLDANCTASTLEVELLAGWNYVSTNVTPDNYAISSLFEDNLGDNLLKVLGDDVFALGQSYTPGIPSVFNSLQMHMDAAGYVIKVESDGTWSSTGDPVDVATTPLDLNEGWNIIGYLPQAAMNVDMALSSIEGTIGTVIDGQSGTVWNPANPNEFNSLTELEPGRSYWVRMLEASTLVYPSGDAPDDGSGMTLAHTRTGDNAAELATGWDVVRFPGAAALAAEVRLDELPVQGEAYIGAFVGETCVAARPVLTLSANTAAQMAIMLEGPSEVSFKLWVDGIVYPAQETMLLEAGDEGGQGGDILPIIRFGSEANGVATQDWVQSFSIAPVPASGEAWVNLELAQGSQVNISILDARGAIIDVLHDGYLNAGSRRIGLNVEQWAAGTYFVKGVSAKGTFSAPFMVR